MMAFIHGKNASTYFDEFDLSGYFSEFAVTVKADTAETTTFQTAAKTYVAGLPDGTVSLKGLFDGDADAVDEYLDSVLGADAGGVFTGIQQTAAVGVQAKLAQALTTEYQVTTPVNDVVSVTGSVQSDGGVDTGKLLTPAVALTTSTDGTAVDNGAASTNGGVGHLHVVANTRDGNVTIDVQHSADDITYVDLDTFTVVGASTVTSERSVVAAGTTVNRYMRYQSTVAGSSGSATVVVAFARR